MLYNHEMIDIYCHTNRITCLRYVGFSMHGIEKRWQRHVFSSKAGKCLFSEAIRTSGKDAFDHDVICTVDNVRDAKILERHFIEMLNTWGPLGYNMTRGGNGNGSVLRGRKFTEDHRRKLSEAHKGKIVSKETRKKMSEAARSKIVSEETRQKHSENMMGEKNPNFGKELPEETRSKISEALTGRSLSEETCQKISNAGSGQKRSNETKEKMRNHKFSEEHRRKLSEAAKLRYKKES